MITRFSASTRLLTLGRHTGSLLLVLLTCVPALVPGQGDDTLALRADRRTLEDHREYRLGYPTAKTRAALREAYAESNLLAAFVTMRQKFATYLLADGAPSPADDPADGDQPGVYSIVEKTDATTAWREAINEVLAGQLQLGNQYLLMAGRRKFPSVVTPTDRANIRTPFGERDEWKELALSGLEFETGIIEGLNAIRSMPRTALHPAGQTSALRSRGGSETLGTSAEGFPNYTILRELDKSSGGEENFTDADADFLRTEYSVLFTLLNRRGLASTALVDRLRRLAFRENNEVDPRQRHGEAGEVKKEDLNRRAMRTAQRDAQLFFYSGLVLRSQLPAKPGALSQDDFKLHNGDKAFAALSQLNLQFKDIRDGRLPSGLADQFVPSPNKRIGTAGGTGYLSDAVTAITRARSSQDYAEVKVKELESGQVQRVEFNRSIRESYLTQLGQLTGFLLNKSTGVLADPLDPTKTYDLKTPESRQAFVASLDGKIQAAIAQARSSDRSVDSNLVGSLGVLGDQILAYSNSHLQADFVAEQLAQVPVKIQNVEDKTNSSRAIIKDANLKRTISDAAFGYVTAAVKASLAAAQATADPSGSSQGVAAVQSIALETLERGERVVNRYVDQAERLDLAAVEKDSAIKDLLLGSSILGKQAKVQSGEIAASVSRLDNTRRQVTDLVENLAEYRADAAQLFFLDHSLEAEADASELQANDDLQDCLSVLYDLTRTLEFYWTEKFQNPVQTVDGGIVTLPNFANEFTEIDDLYAINDARDAEKYLNTLGFSTSGGSSGGWDSTLRALRQSIPDTGRVVVVSLRQDVFGYTVPERALDILSPAPPNGTRGQIVQIHNNGTILAGREDLYAYYENEQITKFRDRLQAARREADEFAFGTNRDPRDFTPGFELVFATNERSAYFFDAREWNTRIETIAVDVRTEGGFLPPNQEENFIRLNLIQEGTVAFQRSFPLELSDRQFDVYKTEFKYLSDRMRISPYEFPVQASVNGSTGPYGGQPRALPYFFSPVCSNWRVVLDPMSSLANNYTDINRIKDIRLTLTLRSGIPPTVQEGL